MEGVFSIFNDLPSIDFRIRAQHSLEVVWSMEEAQFKLWSGLHGVWSFRWHGLLVEDFYNK